jgi:hypothetical protein
MIIFDSRFLDHSRFLEKQKSPVIYDVIITDKIFLAMPLLKLRCKKIIIYFVSSNKRSGDMLFKLLEN